MLAKFRAAKASPSEADPSPKNTATHLSGSDDRLMAYAWPTAWMIWVPSGEETVGRLSVKKEKLSY